MHVVCARILTCLYPLVYPRVCSVGGATKNSSCASGARDYSIVRAWLFDSLNLYVWLLGRLYGCLLITRLFGRQLREKLVKYVESSVKGAPNTSLSDVRQYAGTLTVVTSKPEQNTKIMLASVPVCSPFTPPSCKRIWDKYRISPNKHPGTSA